MSEFARDFGIRVKRLRQSRSMSQEDLADASGLHRTHISLIERAHRSVQLETLEKIAIALQVQPSELMPRVRFRTRKPSGR